MKFSPISFDITPAALALLGFARQIAFRADNLLLSLFMFLVIRLLQTLDTTPVADVRRIAVKK